MFIAMNRFKVSATACAAFEAMWTGRESYLAEVAGFDSFALLRGPALEDHVLYASHTVWRGREAFEDWTRSEAFRMAHRNAGSNQSLYLEHPQFEGFEVIQTIAAKP
jgi:heme-degrading monooxygenase HmoA